MAKRVAAEAKEQRAKWAAQAAKEREARKAPGAARLAWLERPSVKAGHSAEWLKAQVEACKAVVRKAKAVAK